jgi:hypothetical protein
MTIWRPKLHWLLALEGDQLDGADGVTSCGLRGKFVRDGVNRFGVACRVFERIGFRGRVFSAVGMGEKDSATCGSCHGMQRQRDYFVEMKKNEKGS